VKKGENRERQIKTREVLSLNSNKEKQREGRERRKSEIWKQRIKT
jgi:hypothetical protein